MRLTIEVRRVCPDCERLGLTSNAHGNTDCLYCNPLVVTCSHCYRPVGHRGDPTHYSLTLGRFVCPSIIQHADGGSSSVGLPASIADLPEVWCEKCVSPAVRAIRLTSGALAFRCAEHAWSLIAPRGKGRKR